MVTCLYGNLSYILPDFFWSTAVDSLVTFGPQRNCLTQVKLQFLTANAHDDCDYFMNEFSSLNWRQKASLPAEKKKKTTEGELRIDSNTAK
jgi:hypothetical protein